MLADCSQQFIKWLYNFFQRSSVAFQKLEQWHSSRKMSFLPQASNEQADAQTKPQVSR